MGLRARLFAEEPEKIEFTLKITASAKEWEEIRDAIDAARDRGIGGHQMLRLGIAITNLLGCARKIFWSDDDPDGKDALA